MSKFTWGKIIERFQYDLDGTILNIIKYHPWILEGLNTKVHNDGKIEYHCEELNESHLSIDSLLISWIARKNLGLNQYALVSGICRSLSIKHFE